MADRGGTIPKQKCSQAPTKTFPEKTLRSPVIKLKCLPLMHLFKILQAPPC